MQFARGRKAVRLLSSAVAVGALGAVFASPASALPVGQYAPFVQCPVANAAVNQCIYSETTSGSFKLGNTTVPIPATKKIVLQGGVIASFDPVTGFEIDQWVNAKNGVTLSKTPLEVPGGLLGIMDASGFGGLLLDLFEAAIHGVNGVQATAELVGPVEYNFTNFASASGQAIKLPVRIKLDNPFLGSGCYIGSSSSPVNLSLTTGTTSPPPGNTPLTGDIGSVDYLDGGNLLAVTNNKLVGNTFSVPRASGCGSILFRLLINAAVDLKVGLPAASGKSAAILQGNLKAGNADKVRY